MRAVRNADLARRVFSDMQFVPETVVESGEHVVGLERRGCWLTIKDGKVGRIEWFDEPQEALAAAGIGLSYPSTASFIVAWNRGDTATAAAVFHPDVRFDNSSVFLDQEPLHGREAVRTFLAEAIERWTYFEWTIEELIEAGDQAVAVVRSRVKSSQSDVEIDQRLAWHLEFADNLVIGMTSLPDRDAALAAAGF